MPLIAKRKPAWQRGSRPPTKAHREHFAILAGHEQKFSRAFHAILRELLTPDVRRTIERAVREHDTVETVMQAIPFFNLDNPEAVELWRGFARRMERAYESVIDDVVSNEQRKRGWEFNIRKSEDVPIPVSPAIGTFVRLKALERAVDLGKKEDAKIRSILTRGLETGAHPSSMVDEIFETVGLTDKQAARVANMVTLARSQGATADVVSGLRQNAAERIRMQRARAIARTESNEALATGIQATWRQAAEQGVMPQDSKKQWTAMRDERMSELCEDLDNQTVGLNETFSSDVEPGFDGPGPPAHVNCRCTLTLVFPE